MKWIKASERLPEEKRFYNCRFEGCPVVYYIDKSNKAIVLNGEIMDESIFYKIEWLDESQPSGKSAEEILKSLSDWLMAHTDIPVETIVDFNEFSALMIEQYANQQPVNDGWVRVDSESGCGTCKHIANDGKYPCNVCGDGDYVMYEPLPEPPKQ